MDKIFNTFNIEPSINILQTLAYSGYKLETAIADIIDNSIGHGSNRVDLNFNFNSNSIQDWSIEILDDGCGMDSDKLSSAFIMADKSINDARDTKDLGKFGVGMKTASISQADYVLVVSKKDNCPFTAKAIDMNYLDKTKQWKGLDFDKDDSYSEYIKNHGTIVIWKNLKFLNKSLDYDGAKKELLSQISEVENYLSMVFHRFISSGKIKIFIQGNEIKAWDPFFLDHPGTNKFDKAEIEYQGHKIIVNSYILPSREQCNEEQFEYMTRGDALGHQGFYIYRRDRMILAGEWLNLKKIKLHQKLNSLRISIDFDADLDSILNVGFTKSSVDFPKTIELRLEQIALNGRKKIAELNKNKIIKTVGNKETKLDEIWSSKKINNGVQFQINENHPLIKEYTRDMNRNDVKKLFRLISSNLPTMINSNNNIDLSNLLSDNEILDMMKTYYLSAKANNINEYTANKTKFINGMKTKILNTEPFNHFPDLVYTFFEGDEL